MSRPRMRTGVSFRFSPLRRFTLLLFFASPPIYQVQLFLSRRVLFLRPCLLSPRAVHMFLIGRLSARPTPRTASLRPVPVYLRLCTT
ncbi:hypothetical protein C8Q74DRAFT_558158 [Fomes fomentarius]|nr:hypothetical protein C8Q74DRAFT_558158 [Fomes fomentarius]